MNELERFKEALLFGSPDKIPLQPGGPRESTLKRWREEGLPENVSHGEYVMKKLGIDYPRPAGRTQPAVSFRMIPEFEEKVLEHKDGHYLVQDWMGAIVEISDEFDISYLRAGGGKIDFVTRRWHKCPVENRDDWAEMKKRYNTNTEGRFPDDFEHRCAKLKHRDYVVSVNWTGPFWQLREWCGFEGLCMMIIEKPDLVKEMASFWTDFVKDILSRLLEGTDIDHAFIQEDMAYKMHSMISPDMTREFIAPAYKEWVPLLKKHGCDIIELDSDGFIEELIPIWIECGINVCSPIEVAAGNDLLKFRERFGRKMAYRGGVDKRIIARGGREIEQHLESFVPALLKDGGFIPSCDHAVPHDISLENYVHYTETLARLTGWL